MAEATESPKVPQIPTEMRAIYTERYGAPRDVLQLRTVPTPQMPTDKVMIKVMRASTHAGDWHLIRGTPFFLRLLFGGILKPKIRIPGSELCGRVHAIGSEVVTDLHVGDIVFGDTSECGFGAFAEYVVVPAATVVKVPVGVSKEGASACCTSAIAALQAVRDLAGVKEGDSVLVVGATGGVGCYVVQMCGKIGARVTAVCGTSKSETMKNMGVHAVIDYSVTDVVDAGVKYDVIIDAACFRSALDYVPILNKGGKYVLVGGSTKRFLQVMFCAPWFSFSRKIVVKALDSKPTPEDMATLRDWLKEGRICAHVDRRFPFEQCASAIHYVEDRKVFGKVVIDIADDDN